MSGMALTVPTDDEIGALRQRGRAIAVHNREVAKLEEQIAGLTWGSGNAVVKGSGFSPATRAVFAQFCIITKANPITHVDVLGGKPYLNAAYWADHLNNNPYFHHFTQRDLSPSVEQALREQSARAKASAKELKAGGMDVEASGRMGRALALEDEADDIAMARARWSPPANMAVVIETTIHRYTNAAPMDAIRSGVIADLRGFLVTVTECNWAGGKQNDPVGNAGPALTARTRSLRRAAVKSFSAWLAPYEAQIAKAEEIIDAEFTIVEEDARERRAALPSPTGPQAVSTGNGEPTAVNPEGAQELPVRGEVAQPVQQQAPAPEFDTKDARNGLFATLNAAGITGDARKQWAKDNGFPESTSNWTRQDYDRARELLIAPTRDAVLAAAKLRGIDLRDMSLSVLGKESAVWLKDWKQIQAKLDEGEDWGEEA